MDFSLPASWFVEVCHRHHSFPCNGEERKRIAYSLWVVGSYLAMHMPTMVPAS